VKQRAIYGNYTQSTATKRNLRQPHTVYGNHTQSLDYAGSVRGQRLTDNIQNPAKSSVYLFAEATQVHICGCEHAP